MLKTSGLLFTPNADGSANIGYEDYNVELFDGADYEVMYYLDEYNFGLLLDLLGISNKDKIKNHLIDMFDKNFDSNKFEDFCKEKNIKFRKNVHIK
ncbi:MAG: hypothetical protein N4R28_01325 [Lactobacillus iners]|nr:hypothetical protein [Lactobacillus iners]MCT7765729.1 hypothetical protein [Lactobacillus iners]MCT7767471.1 hypothetical protein [Lactobacillus iners]MCT7780218.1 hypothetical protein [Lactobacillus iners]MCT7782032.1 hypothetical protein [Lactobacillus iners]